MSQLGYLTLFALVLVVVRADEVCEVIRQILQVLIQCLSRMLLQVDMKFDNCAFKQVRAPQLFDDRLDLVGFTISRLRLLLVAVTELRRVLRGRVAGLGRRGA